MNEEKVTSPKFDEAGNMITTKPKADKVEALIPRKKGFCCKYCDKEWEREISKTRHESWCPKNPHRRKYYRKNEGEKPKVEPNPNKIPKIEAENKVILQMDKFTVEELRKIDRSFGLTDEQIVNYIRGKEKRS